MWRGTALPHVSQSLGHICGYICVWFMSLFPHLLRSSPALVRLPCGLSVSCRYTGIRWVFEIWPRANSGERKKKSIIIGRGGMMFPSPPPSPLAQYFFCCARETLASKASVRLEHGLTCSPSLTNGSSPQEIGRTSARLARKSSTTWRPTRGIWTFTRERNRSRVNSATRNSPDKTTWKTTWTHTPSCPRRSARPTSPSWCGPTRPTKK